MFAHFDKGFCFESGDSIISRVFSRSGLVTFCRSSITMRAFLLFDLLVILNFNV